MGSPLAQIVLVEFSDFECPFCRRFAQATLPALRARFIDTGKVRLVFVQLPIVAIHPNSMKAAQLAECARTRGRFEQIHDELFRGLKLGVDSLDRAFALLQRDNSSELQSGATCVDEAKVSVEANVAFAGSVGVFETPSFLIGQLDAEGNFVAREALSGSKTTAAFEAAFERIK